jgi:hypothetical protein
MTKMDMAFQLAKVLMGSKGGRAMIHEAVQRDPDNGIKNLIGQFMAGIPDVAAEDPKSARDKWEAVFNQTRTSTPEMLLQGVTSELIPNAVRAGGDIGKMYHGMLGKTLRNLKSDRPLSLSNKNAVDQQLEANALRQDYKGGMTQTITDAIADTVQNTSDAIFNDRRFARQAANYAYNPISAGAADYYGRQLTHADRYSRRSKGE